MATLVSLTWPTGCVICRDMLGAQYRVTVPTRKSRGDAIGVLEYEFDVRREVAKSLLLSNKRVIVDLGRQPDHDSSTLNKPISNVFKYTIAHA